MLQHDILLEKKLNFFSKTTRQNKKNGYTTPPPRIFCKQMDGCAAAYLFSKKRISKSKQKTILKNNSRQEAGGFKQ
ncbi:hypothetical protein [Treponema denticola]|uniref:hypothetical protein n=1 Tax=Treponema denticola TaxID=158 RepID=UPI001C076E54|nr:hypothetical protein [Treponema denticola]